jgi:hypothetical protein
MAIAIPFNVEMKVRSLLRWWQARRHGTAQTARSTRQTLTSLPNLPDQPPYLIDTARQWMRRAAHLARSPLQLTQALIRRWRARHAEHSAIDATK